MKSIVAIEYFQNNCRVQEFQLILYFQCYNKIHPSILLCRYSPFWSLASLRTRLHSSLSSARLLHPLLRISDASLRMTSLQLVLGVIMWYV